MQEGATAQLTLQKESVKVMQRLEGLAAQHAAFADRLIAAETRAAGEVSPRGMVTSKQVEGKTTLYRSLNS